VYSRSSVDTYPWILLRKATTIFVSLRILFVTLQNTNRYLLGQNGPPPPRSWQGSGRIHPSRLRGCIWKESPHHILSISPLPVSSSAPNLWEFDLLILGVWRARFEDSQQLLFGMKASLLIDIAFILITFIYICAVMHLIWWDIFIYPLISMSLKPGFIFIAE